MFSCIWNPALQPRSLHPPVTAQSESPPSKPATLWARLHQSHDRLLPPGSMWRRAVLATFIVVLAVGVLAAIETTLTAPRIYEGVVSLKFSRPATKAAWLYQNYFSYVPSNEELSTYVNEIASATIAKRVAARLNGADLERFMRPYRVSPAASVSALEKVLLENRRVTGDGKSSRATIYYRHPNPWMAAEVANLLADEYVGFVADLYSSGEQSPVEIAILNSAQPPAEGRGRTTDDRRRATDDGLRTTEVGRAAASTAPTRPRGAELGGAGDVRGGSP